ncbi:hypothetical protein BDQ17DRAFT_1436119 [Cyathus striatus]|nr:hypothetical protein BDQ17DRAFT_1436119 [Cyathus striatus]
MSPSARRPERAFEVLVTKPDGDDNQPVPSSSPMNNIIHSAARLKITEGLSELTEIPALKIVSGALARFVEQLDQMKKNKEDYMELALSVFETIKAAKDEVIRFQESNTDLEIFNKVFGDFEIDLLEIMYGAENLMKQPFLQQVWSTSTTKATL